VDKSGFGFSIHGPSLLNMSQACRPLLAKKKKEFKTKIKKIFLQRNARGDTLVEVVRINWSQIRYEE
jgi:hypothetical protein